jgi:hypothetical protein
LILGFVLDAHVRLCWLCDANADSGSHRHFHSGSDCYTYPDCHASSANRDLDAHTHFTADGNADANLNADTATIPAILHRFVSGCPVAPGE